MKRTFKEAIRHRRSHYALTDQSPISDDEILDIINTAVLTVPSANNSQTSRIVLLLGDQHRKLWDIVGETFRRRLSPEKFIKLEEKIKKSFSSGYGTVLFFEDTSEVRKLQEKFPVYKESYLKYSHHTNAIHQYAIWVMLEDAGFGASLQHYNPVIDDEVKKNWNLPEDWELIAEMPFGISLETPPVKTKLPLEKQVFKFS
ncbi:MAG: nitroreductase family protein [Bacteroidales bacterium]|nr:nitroreductase family protein [Bacteroidales bacterium]